MKKASFVYRTKALFSTMCSADAERDAPCGRDVCFASDVRFAREKRSTSHHFAAKPQNIIATQAATSLAPSAQTSLSLCVIVSLGTVPVDTPLITECVN